MRILHTADWHVGKRLGRYDRSADFVAVLDEIVELADAEDVDLVIAAGDLFDRAYPPLEALRLVLATLERLARPERPVVAIAGNHDSAELFELLAPLVRDRNVHLMGRVLPPEDGGVLELEAGGEPVLVAGFPFLRLGQAVSFVDDVEAWAGAYADKIRTLSAAYDAELGRRRGDAVRLLTAHVLMAGAKVGGGGAPRGERSLHMADAYAADRRAIPSGAQYVALGHVHTPQVLPATAVPTAYSGSPLELDFGEAGEEKGVLFVEAAPGRPASLRSIPLRRGRRLCRARGRWEEVTARDDLADVFLDLTVVTDGPDPGLADRARQAFPYLVKVRLDYERRGETVPLRRDEPWDRLFCDYYRKAHETEPPEDLLGAFRDIYAEVVAGD